MCCNVVAASEPLTGIVRVEGSMNAPCLVMAAAIAEDDDEPLLFEVGVVDTDANADEEDAIVAEDVAMEALLVAVLAEVTSLSAPAMSPVSCADSFLTVDGIDNDDDGPHPILVLPLLLAAL